jgi:hypothetical protein
MMSRKYVLIPVLVALAVLMVALYPTANVTQRASAAPRTAVVTKYLMMPAAAFSVTEDGKDYVNLGEGLGVLSGAARFVAPVYLPPGARIKMIKLFAYDKNLDRNVCAYMYETHPKNGGRDRLAFVCTKAVSGFQQPEKYFTHYVKWYYGYFIEIYIENFYLNNAYAVMIKYNVRQ